MEGAPRLKKHDNVQKQMSTFEKLLQHAVNRFSKEKLYNMLRLVTRSIPNQPSIPNRGSRQRDGLHKILSVARLREIISNVRDGKRKSLHKDEESNLLKYFETFFHDLNYLKELKRQFDEKIYTCLYGHFYDPAEDIEVPKQRSNEQVDDLDSGHVTDDDRPYNPPSNGYTDDSIWEVNLDIMTSNQKLAYAVREIYRVNQKWDALLSDQQLDLTQFDPDSHHELLQFKDYSNFEAILRLVPDLFVKSYKSVELAKLWWTQANKVYKEFPAGRGSSRDFANKVAALEEKMAFLAAEISRDEDRLAYRQQDLEGLRSRDDRFEMLNLTQEEMEIARQDVSTQYHEILEQRDALTDRMHSLKRGSPQYKELQRRLAEYERKLDETQDELRLLSYHTGILQGDFQVELQVRPEIIRYLGSAQEQLDELRESVAEKKWERRQAEKQLVLIRTNREKMREIMTRYATSETWSPTHGDQEEELRDLYDTDDSRDGRMDRRRTDEPTIKNNKITYKAPGGKPVTYVREHPKDVSRQNYRSTDSGSVSTIPIDEDTDENNDLDSPEPSTDRTYGVRESQALRVGFQDNSAHGNQTNQSHERSRIPRPEPVKNNDW